MTKHEALARLDRGDVTWGHLKHWLSMVEFDGHTKGRSVVNPSMLKRQSLSILSAGIEPYEDNELVVSPKYSPRRNAKGTTIAVNVMRESHGPAREGEGR